MTAGAEPRGTASSGAEHSETRLAATRAGRHARIVEILATHQVRSQTELQRLLAEEGIEATQATLSRDLDELGAVKLRAADGGAGVYVVPEDGTPVRGVSGGTDRLARLVTDLLVRPTAAATSRCCARPRARRTTWQRHWTGRGCPTWWARSPVTTRSSSSPASRSRAPNSHDGSRDS